MRVVILGKGNMLAQIILGVKDSGADIVGVFRYEETSSNAIKLAFQDYFLPTKDFILIKNLNLPQIKMKSANSQEFRDFLISNNVDLVIVGTWRERIRKKTFDIPTIATVNVHPSLLPKYRGPNPYMQVILHDEKVSGLTLHLVDENFDSGAILAQKEIPIKSTDTSKELRERTHLEVRNFVADFIKNLSNTNNIVPIPQKEQEATYFHNITGEERMIDFRKQTSEDIYRTVRALHPFLPCYITYKGKFFVVNPYKMCFLQGYITDYVSGDLIDKNPKEKSLTFVCADKKAIEFMNLKLYHASLLTSYYIQNYVKCTII